MQVPSATTRLAAVIGHPVRHSLSPTLHNAAFAATGLDWVYLAFEVLQGRASDALFAMRVLGIEGLSVTMPHKADVAAAVDKLSPIAERLGAVNCVRRDGSLLIVENTDGEGLLRSLAEDHAARDRAPHRRDGEHAHAVEGGAQLVEVSIEAGGEVHDRDPLRAARVHERARPFVRHLPLLVREIADAIDPAERRL